MVKDKRILKRIAKQWASSILRACEMSSFDDDSILTSEEQAYLVDEVHKISEKLRVMDSGIFDLDSIIEQAYNDGGYQITKEIVTKK